MERKYWSARGRDKMGPFATRSEALTAFRAAHPIKSNQAATGRNRITTGYGEFGPHFDIRFEEAKGRAA